MFKGTNLRVVMVELLGDGKFFSKSNKYKISDTLKTGHAKDLFGTARCANNIL